MPSPLGVGTPEQVEESDKPGLEHGATRMDPVQSVTPQIAENTPGISGSRVTQKGRSQTLR